MLSADLPTKWRAAAAEFRRFGAEPQARTLESCADDLEGALVAQGDQLLSLQQAAEESGYSIDHLSRMLRDGKLQNAGRRSKPMIRRIELPRKPSGAGAKGAKSGKDGYVSSGLFRDIINSKRGDDGRK